MKNITAKSILLGLLISFALSSCSEKAKPSTAESQKADSTAKAKEDSVETEDLKEVLDAVKR